MTVVVFLRWPEQCFRASASDLKYLKSLLPSGARVVTAKDERGFLKALPRATHVITWHFRREWYALAPRLQVVATPAAGQELVARPGGAKPIVHYGRFQGRFMAENVAAFCLAWARGFYLKVAKNAWPRTEISDKVFELAGTRAVILGYGNVGKAIGEKLSALGVEVQGFSRHRPLTAKELKRLAPHWLILALPSTTGTDDVVNAAFLRRLPRHCVVANVGRGNAIDEAALVQALQTGTIAGAYLDVIKHEPSGTVPTFKDGVLDVRRGNPVKRFGLEGRLVLTPHSSAFASNYLKVCFRELKDDGCI